MHMRYIKGAYLAESARVFGDVSLGNDVNLWFGVVIRGDVAPITIGERTNIQDNAVVHCEYGQPLAIGADVTVGHSAIVHCTCVGDGSLIGMHATILSGATVGKQCIIGAGAVVPPGMDVPDRHMVLGVPGRIIRPVTDDDIATYAHIPQRYVEHARRYHLQPAHPRNRPFGA